MATFWWDALLLGAAQQQSTPPAAVVSPVSQGMGQQFIAFHDGTIDPTLHKIEFGISA